MAIITFIKVETIQLKNANLMPIGLKIRTEKAIFVLFTYQR